MNAKWQSIRVYKGQSVVLCEPTTMTEADSVSVLDTVNNLDKLGAMTHRLEKVEG